VSVKVRVDLKSNEFVFVFANAKSNLSNNLSDSNSLCGDADSIVKHTISWLVNVGINDCLIRRRGEDWGR
jgi:hypothetical protein